MRRSKCCGDGKFVSCKMLATGDSVYCKDSAVRRNPACLCAARREQRFALTSEFAVGSDCKDLVRLPRRAG